MDDNFKKLVDCFSVVFPEVKQDELPRLSIYSYPEWDSVANIQLTMVIEENFNVIIKTEDIEELTSFKLILEYVDKNAKKV
jgi:acyl carrier protein